MICALPALICRMCMKVFSTFYQLMGKTLIERRCAPPAFRFQRNKERGDVLYLSGLLMDKIASKCSLPASPFIF